MLIATAGHVDHGKTTLVGALTGVDTDRLPEEKRRGVSIDLGFAYDTLGTDRTFGFIDVPGHEKFVRNMLAGVGAVDAALLVVAADDGPMPQTREHLAILDLLGISTGIVALTRADLVDETQLQRAAQACQELLADTGLAGAPVIPVSAVSGLGIPDLRNALTALAATTVRDRDARFRLAIDRQFTVPGSGLIVTGTIFSGQVSVGESVNLAPHGVVARVRGLHSQNISSDRAVAGMRCAVNLNATDLGPVEPRRGDWLTGDPAPIPTRRIDALIRVLPTEPRPLAHWTPIHLHHGAGSFPARVALLEQRRIEPGSSALAQLVLDADTLAVHGDRLILRDQSARRTIGGGVVIDPYGPSRGRSKPERVGLLNEIRNLPAQPAYELLLHQAPGGVDAERFGQSRNLTPDGLNAIVSASPSQLVTARMGHSLVSQVRLAPARWARLGNNAIAFLSDWHRTRPDQPGPTEWDVRRKLTEDQPREIVVACITELVAQGKIVRQGRHLKMPTHTPKQSPQDQALWRQVGPLLTPSVTRPPVVTDLSKQLGLGKAELERFLSGAAERGQLTRFAANRYFHPEALARLAAIAEQLGHQYPNGFDARAFRDASGIGRNLTIEVLEYFDNRQLTRRVGDHRILVGKALEMFGPPAAQAQHDQ